MSTDFMAAPSAQKLSVGTASPSQLGAATSSPPRGAILAGEPPVALLDALFAECRRLDATLKEHGSSGRQVRIHIEAALFDRLGEELAARNSINCAFDPRGGAPIRLGSVEFRRGL